MLVLGSFASSLITSSPPLASPIITISPLVPHLFLIVLVPILIASVLLAIISHQSSHFVTHLLIAFWLFNWPTGVLKALLHNGDVLGFPLDQPQAPTNMYTMELQEDTIWMNWETLIPQPNGKDYQQWKAYLFLSRSP